MFSQVIVYSLITGSIYALVALGFTVIYKTVNFFNFTHGAVYTIGAYMAYTLTVFLKLNIIPSFFLPLSLQV
jgi:branched-chain amino acid transport system permease protein